MDCNQVREFILDGYFDQALSERDRCALEYHMQNCDGCLEFAARVKAQAIVPFESLCPMPVPPELWGNIKYAIESRQSVKFRFFAGLNFFRSARFCYMLNILVDGVCIAVLVLAFAGNWMPSIASKQEKPAFSHVAYVSEQKTTSDYGSALEKYFL